MNNKYLSFEINALNYNIHALPILNSITVPLVESFNITTFTHIKFVEDRILRLSNNTGWNEFHICNKIYDLDPYKDIIATMHNGSTCIKIWNDPNKLTEQMQQHNLWYSISVIKKLSDCVEIWNFGTTADNGNIINFYLNNIPLLERFIIYFKHKASDIIDTADKSTLLVRQNPIMLNLNSDREKFGQREKDFLDKTNLDHFLLNNGVRITKRESECLYWLNYGKSAKEIARIMSVSSRTVETHINHVKSKFTDYYSSEARTVLQQDIVKYYGSRYS